MTGLEWLVALLVAGVVLVLAELVLPTHGVLGVLGVLCFLAAVGVCYSLSQWGAVLMLLALLAATPVAWSAAVRWWPYTFTGRRIFLPPVVSQPEPLPFQIGQEGIAVSDLRPMGECELGGRRVSARGEGPVIAAGTRVVVVSADGRTPLVRPVANA
jgi:membrane-bound serine protease (ClpP class)